jgi:hypothetical protein
MTDASLDPFRRRRRWLRRSAAAAAGVTVAGAAGTGLIVLGLDQGLPSGSQAGTTTTGGADDQSNGDPSPVPTPTPDSASDREVCPPPQVATGPTRDRTRTDRPAHPRYDGDRDSDDDGEEDDEDEGAIARDAGYRAAATSAAREPVAAIPSVASVPSACLSPAPPQGGRSQQPSTSQPQVPSSTSGLGGVGRNQQPPNQQSPAGGSHGS